LFRLLGKIYHHQVTKTRRGKKLCAFVVKKRKNYPPPRLEDPKKAKLCAFVSSWQLHYLGLTVFVNKFVKNI